MSGVISGQGVYFIMLCIILPAERMICALISVLNVNPVGVA